MPRTWIALLSIAGLHANLAAQPPIATFLGEASGEKTGDLVRTREAAADLAAIAELRPGSSFSLPLFDNAAVTAKVTRSEPAANGPITLSGIIPGDALGRFTLVVAGGQVSGSVWTDRGAYGLAPTGRETAAGAPIVQVQEWAKGRAVRCAMTRDQDLISPADDRLRRRFLAQPVTPVASEPAHPEGSPPALGACACGDDQATIDVMFVYTTLAKNAAGGAAALQARVNDAVAACNIAFSDSGISGGSPVNRLQARVAGFAEINYDEVSPDWLAHLSRLANPTDGFIDNAIALRDQAHADTVCLIVEDTRFFGGAAYYAVYVRDSAAEVLNWRGLGGGSLTFAHELGHNFGCAHDRGNSSFSLFSYAWGHTFAANNTTYGTLMSYSGAVFIPRFSNPNLTIPTGQAIGIPLNQPLPAYNALAVSQTRWVIASYGDSGRIVDCNNNGLDDSLDISTGRSQDANGNCRPDECEYRVYVDAGNTGAIDGLSWNTAFRDLGEAMTFASLNCNNVSEVWVADGTYRPDRGSNDRYARFELRGGLSLIGGFQGKSRPGGGETSAAQRIIAGGVPVFASILSGDIGTPAIHTDNSYNVLIGQDFGNNALLDGFTVERGYQDYAGAGIWLSNASPTIRNCTFRNNRGGDSAAIEITGAMADPHISDCIFENNTGLGSGGGVGVRNGADATFDRCTFRTSTATYGGAAALYNGAAAVFRLCSFTDNTSASNSGAIDCYLNNQLTLESCELLRNRSTGGSAGAILLHTRCTASLSGTVIRDNTSWGTGGGLWLQSSSATLTDCELTGNAAGDGGGGFSAYSGGAVTLTRCRLADNRARWGGAAALGNAGFIIRNSALHHNTATDGNGGAIDAFGATGSSIVSSALTANTSSDSDGGISLGSGSNLSIINSTIANNRSQNSGGGIGVFNAVLSVANSILWGNTYGNGTAPLQDQQLLVFSGVRTVNRSCVQGLSGQLGGAGNIGGNPRLSSPASGDVALLAGSPCIDSGSNSLLPADAATDLLGGPRRVDDPDTTDAGIGTAPIVDRGAVEYSPAANYCPADFNQDGGIDGADVDAFFVAWEAGEASADVNQDGGIDGADVDTFFAAWEAGGC